MEAAAVVSANQVQVARRLQTGWLETLFLPGTQSVAVLLSHAGQLTTGASSVKFCWTDDLWNPTYSSKAEPIEMLTADGGSILIFTAPPAAAADLRLAVLVQLESAGVELAGVWGSTQTAATLAANWGAAPVSSSAVLAAPGVTAAPAFTEMKLWVA
jgi:hypothetical protein